MTWFPKYMSALGQLQREVSREIDRAQLGEPPSPDLLRAWNNANDQRRKVLLEVSGVQDGQVPKDPDDRDASADKRDEAADKRDHKADQRDIKAAIRDLTVPDLTGGLMARTDRIQAETDRIESKMDRGDSADDREERRK